MQNELNDEKSCGNCKDYSRHYVKTKKNFTAINCGFCLNKHSKAGNKKQPSDVCQHWAQTSVHMEKEKPATEKMLDSISVRIDEIVMMLKKQ